MSLHKLAVRTGEPVCFSLFARLDSVPAASKNMLQTAPAVDL